jgi:hypothetical protein
MARSRSEKSWISSPLVAAFLTLRFSVSFRTST